MLESFNELTDYQPSTKRIEVRGRRLAQATSALMSPPMHPEARLKGESLDFRRKARVSRRAGVIDGRLLSIRLRSEEDECRLYTINAWHARQIGISLFKRHKHFFKVEDNLFELLQKTHTEASVT